jgi:XapX domain-containing protein
VKEFLIAALAGLVVGVGYSLFKIKAPAPPYVALVGLLGMLIGEQIRPLIRDVVSRTTVR